MGQVVPFIARLRDSGDWTAVERARLQELADRLAASGVHVEVIFGATDEGDPWCVVTDADGDVLIHVARIDGRFVVHSAVDDAVNESVDLHTALRDRLAATEDALAPRSATILPFGLSAREAQTFLALIAATAFFYETAAVGGTAEAAEPVRLSAEPDAPPPPPEGETPGHERETAAQGVVLQTAQPGPSLHEAVNGSGPAPTASAAIDPAPSVREEPPPAAPPGPAAPEETARPAERPIIQGTAGDDLLVGTTADEHLVGGDGNDTLRGGGGMDLLEGGAGDDVIEVTSQSTAFGGEGADTFLIQAPAQMGRADLLLGVLADFDAAQGDRILNWLGHAVRFLPGREAGPSPDAKTSPSTPAPDTGLVTTATDPVDGGSTDVATTTLSPGLLGPASRPPLTRVEVDLDGDGVADGYLLVGPRGALTLGLAPGAAFDHSDPLG